MITSLNGEWFIKSQKIKDIKGSVPGSVLGALLENRLIGEPSYRDNIEEIREKYLYDNYTFYREFSLKKDLLKMHNYLFIDGIDTVAKVFINGIKVADLCDMFMRRRIELDNSILSENNEIRVEFTSPYKYIADYKGGLFRSFGVTELKAPCVRKAGYSFGWDWCENLADSGIYRDIYILSTDTGYVSDMCYECDFMQNGKAKVSVKFDAVTVKSEEIRVRLVGHGYDCSLKKVCHNTTEFEFVIDKPRLWFPNGYGEQPLYTLEVKFGEEKYNYRIGIRKIVIDDKKDDYGKNFAIFVNDVKIFVKGSNYIPEDLVLSRITEQRTRELLRRIVSNNQNVVRVWGGGFYPGDYFYDICDELGLLVFQDLMFACAAYDMSDSAFKNLICEETVDVLSRIRRHACLCVIDGDNECEDGINGNGADIMSQYSEMRSIIGKVVKENCNIYFLPSSPTSGELFNRPNDTENLDTHYWSVWHGLKPYENYKELKPRLLSEFGIQSLPAYETVKKFADKNERYASSYVMTYHQRDYTFTNDKNIYYVRKYYKNPKDLKELCYLSSLVQAEGLKCCVEHLRMNKPRCNGAIYWQLNDCWMGQSESVIDYCGMPKAASYYEKKFFAPHLVTVCEKDDEILIGISNDTPTDTEYVVNYKFRNFDGDIIDEKKIKVKVAATECKSLELIKSPFGSDDIDKYIYVTLQNEVGEVVSDAIYQKFSDKEIRYPKAKVTLRNGNAATITVTAEEFAKNIYLVCGNAIFSDNYFTLQKGESKQIRTNVSVNMNDIEIITLNDLMCE